MLSPSAFCFKQLVQNCEHHHPDGIGKSQYISNSKFSIVAINGDIMHCWMILINVINTPK